MVASFGFICAIDCECNQITVYERTLFNCKVRCECRRQKCGPNHFFFSLKKLTSFARRIVLYFLFLALATKQFTTNSAPNHRMLLIQMLSDIIFVCQVKYKNCYYHLLGAVNIFVSLFFCVYPPLNCFSMYFLRPFTGGRRVLFPSYIKIK